MSATNIKHAWLENLELSTALSPVALLVGERVSDRFALSSDSGGRPVRLASLPRAAWQVLQSRYAALLRYDPLKSTISTQFAADDCTAMSQLNADLNKAGATANLSLEALLDSLVDKAASADFAVMIDDADFLFGEPAPQAQMRVQRLIRYAEKGEANDAGHYAPMLLLCFRRAVSIPEALNVNSIRQIRLGLPTRDERKAYAAQFGQSLGVGEAREALADRVASLTEGEQLNTLQRILDLARKKGAGTATEIEHLARAVKEGLNDTPWAGRALRDALGQATARFEHRIKGQQSAVANAVRQLKRSALNLSGAHQGQASRGPRAVLFLAGPTGVGKTELAKAIAELVFGDEGAIVRFDMGEFGDAHADARLIGSPPGYVGFSQGGELTEAVRNRPFSVLLFDEIEKAHPRILDKFLSLLDDGRVTDGRGNAAYFGESVVVFTSNLGARDFTAEQSFPELEQGVKKLIEAHFTQTINRPELLGRIGLDNLIVFDFIRRDVAKQILDKMLKLVVQRVRETQAVEVRFSHEASGQIEELCLAPKVLALGGRQIAKTLEGRLVTPLAERLFDGAGAEVCVIGVGEEGIVVKTVGQS